MRFPEKRSGLWSFLILSVCLSWNLNTVWAATDRLSFSFHEFPPFCYKADNKYVGPFIDIAEAICAEMGKKCTFNFVPNRRSKMMLREGKVNGNFPLGWNKKRSEWLYFSIPLMSTEYGFFVQEKNALTFTDLNDLQEYKIGVFGPSNTSYSLEQLQQKMVNTELKPFSIVIRPNADFKPIKMLPLGRIDAYYVNKDVGLFWIKQKNIAGVRYAGKQRSLDYFIGFAKAHNEKTLVESFNQAALKLHNQGIIREILQNYGIDPAVVNPDAFRKYQIELGGYQ